MESKEVKSNAEYTLLDTTVEGKEVVAYPSTMDKTSVRGDSSWYPGIRRPVLSATGPPPNSILLPTAGNALQAVDRSVLEYVNTCSKEELVAVSVPDNMPPGSTLLVVTPSGRTIEAQIPQGVFAGHTFLVQVPPPDAHVVAIPSPPAAAVAQQVGENTRVVPGHDMEDTDLHLQVVTPDVEMATIQDTQQHQHHQQQQSSLELQSQEMPDATDDTKNKSVS